MTYEDELGKVPPRRLKIELMIMWVITSRITKTDIRSGLKG